MATIYSGSALPDETLNLTLVGSIDLAGAEISTYDAGSKQLFVTSSTGLQIIDLTNPASPALVSTIAIATLSATGGDITSVSAKNGVVAVAVPDAVKTNPGKVVFIDAATGSVLGSVTVGALPDMVTFTPDGSKVLVANEGEPLTDANGTLVDPAGSISIIDVSGGFAAPTVATATFTAFNAQRATLVDNGLRLDAGKSVAQGVEPEYIAVTPDGTKAIITLQENNAFATLDLATNTITSIIPLGTKDYGNPLNAGDFSDRDNDGIDRDNGGTAVTAGSTDDRIEILPSAGLNGLYQPDAIASYAVGATAYFVTANEGDAYDGFGQAERVDEIRVKDASLDAALVADIVANDTTGRLIDEASIKADANYGRLTVSKFGDTDGDGDLDQLQSYGARSFSIWDANGNLVFDSGSLIERALAELTPTFFNANNGVASQIDQRSDDKAAEPEGVTVGTINGKTYAFVALERAGGGVMAFDITDPADVKFVKYARNPADISGEGVLFIDQASSPNGGNLVVLTSEVSGSISVFEAQETFTLQLLHFADAEAGLLAGETAPNLAALVDAFDGEYANTLILAGGDNFLPGPFLAAGTDSSVSATHTKGNNPGAADIEIHNRIGVEASTIGNHEFDLGTNAFSDVVNDAAFPYLSANLDFSGDTAISGRYQETVGVGGLEDAATLARKIVPSAVVQKGGETIGLVGATTQILETISSTGGVEVKGFAGDGSEANDMALLASQLQIVIDDLRSQGVNKIVLMAHLQQIALETALAPLLEGVDIILAAGSNTRLGDADDVAVAFPGHAADFANDYPIVTAGADGKPTLIVNTDNEYTYLGRLVVQFDENGEILTNSVGANQSINGAYAATTENVAAAWGDTDGDLSDTAFAAGTKGAGVKQITDAVGAVIAAKDGQIAGYTNVYLEGERAFVRSQETNLGNITADANREAADDALGTQPFIVSLKNGGGIRAQIGSVDVVTGDKEPPLANPDAGKPTGGVSQLDIENALRFNNVLMVFDTTPQGLLNILEHAATRAPGNGGYAQIGGVKFSFDPTNAGTKVESVSLLDENGNTIAAVVENGVVLANAPALISVVTLNFTANGGDGYPIKANGTNFRYLLDDGTLSAPIDPALDFAGAAGTGNVPANGLGEQKAMFDFMQEFYGTPETAYDVADTPQAQDERIQNLSVKAEDTVLDGAPIRGSDGDDPALNGTTGDDVILALGGNDKIFAGLGADRIEGGEGNDFIGGGGGADEMIGGAGNDTYQIENSGDAVVEDVGGGTDIITGFIDITLAANVENGVLYGSAVSATGNDLNNVLIGNGGANTLTGLDGNDFLIGGAGTDTFLGGLGNDTFVVDSQSETITEAANEGSDTVQSEATFSLAGIANVENLQLKGTAAINGTGNALANRLTGNSAANTLDGGEGNDLLIGGLGTDTLTGGLGTDRFLFNTAPGAGNVDTITDFSAVFDYLLIENSVFTAATATGLLSSSMFRSGTAAADADDIFVYDQATGQLFYDADGNGAGASQQFVQLTAGTALTAADIFII